MPCTSDKDLEDSTAHLGFEAQLWLAADKLRNNVAPADYQHDVLGLISLKDSSDRSEEPQATHALIEPDNPRQTGVCIVANPGKRGNAFYVPPHTDLQAHWERLAGKDTPEDSVMPSLVALQNGGKCGVSRPFHPLIPAAAVGRREVTNPAGRRFARRSCHSPRQTLVSDHPDSRSTPGTGRKRTGHTTASAHDLYTHFLREPLLATVHAIPSLPKL